jgi:hypothetical protein
MNTALRHELEQLLQETNALLARPDFEPSIWEAYEARRAAIFARIQGMTPPADEEEHEVIAALIRNILAQDAEVIQKAQMRLSYLRTELATVATLHRALKGYASFSSPALFQRDV